MLKGKRMGLKLIEHYFKKKKIRHNTITLYVPIPPRHVSAIRWQKLSLLTLTRILAVLVQEVECTHTSEKVFLYLGF